MVMAEMSMLGGGGSEDSGDGPEWGRRAERIEQEVEQGRVERGRGFQKGGVGRRLMDRAMADGRDKEMVVRARGVRSAQQMMTRRSPASKSNIKA